LAEFFGAFWKMATNADHARRWRMLLAIVPAGATAIVFEATLGHRHDYTGHFLAGFGGTWMALLVVLKSLLSPVVWPKSASWIAPVCIGCILLGAALEATAFRIAKWDEVDFCNQSLGAVIAGLASLAYVHPAEPAAAELDRGMIVGIAFLGLGGCFAVA
jgi:hypothetical protein